MTTVYRPRFTMASLVAAAGAYAVQQMMVYPALPTLARTFHATPTRSAWVVTSFMLGAAALTPLIGRVGDQRGKQRVLLVVLLVFMLGSLGSALATSLWSLIAFRALSGCGTAIFPLAYGIVRDEFPPERVKVGVGTLSSMLGFGGGLGAVVSGAVIDNLSWRWLFAIGALPAAGAAVLVWRYVPASPRREDARRADVAGSLLLCTSLLALLVAISEGAPLGWTSLPVLGAFALAAILAAALLAAERDRPHAILDLRLMGARPMLLGSIASMTVGFTYFSSFVLVPQLIETTPPPRGIGYAGFGASATQAGIYLVPSAAAMLVFGPLAGICGRRFGSRVSLTLGLALASAGAAELAVWHGALATVIVGMTTLGAGIGAALASLAGLMLELAPSSETGIVNSMNTVLRTVGGAVGGQLAAAFLAAAVLVGQTVPRESGFRDAFWAAAAASAFGATLAFFARVQRPERELAPALAES